VDRSQRQFAINSNLDQSGTSTQENASILTVCHLSKMTGFTQKSVIYRADSPLNGNHSEVNTPVPAH
jgi:hypothetical protein